jgi:hypothetical protein
MPIDIAAIREKLTELADWLSEIPELLAAAEGSTSERIVSEVAAELRELEMTLWKEGS